MNLSADLGTTPWKLEWETLHGYLDGSEIDNVVRRTGSLRKCAMVVEPKLGRPDPTIGCAASWKPTDR